MTSELLRCFVCPKKPNFSDISHLLTHVGSKGHLSHLHKLQVQSHEELDAAHKLARYNQWFQEHDVAAQLSDRMRQKQHKHTIKKEADRQRTRGSPIKNDERARKAAPELEYGVVPSACNRPALPVIDSGLSPDELVDADYSPLPAIRYQILYPSSPSLSNPLFTDEMQAEGSSAETKSPTKRSPGTPQLKGTQWPGMNLWDAAPEEQKRRRNQKKDSSVLRSLERNAGLVEPLETVHSPAGVVLKQRHMDNLENDSPVEGEHIITKPSPRRRKSSAPRVTKQTMRAKNRPAAKRRPGRPRKRLETPTKLRNSFIGDMGRATPHYSPNKDENRAFELTVRDVPRKRKSHGFTIYQDSPPGFGGDGSSEAMPSAYLEVPSARNALATGPNIWQPHTEAYDPFKLIRDRFTDYTNFPDVGQGKENALASDDVRSIQCQDAVNPLIFQHNFEQFSVLQTPVMQNRFTAGMAPDMDPFHDTGAYSQARNPLMVALEGLKTPSKSEGYEFDAAEVKLLAAQHRQPLFAP